MLVNSTYIFTYSFGKNYNIVKYSYSGTGWIRPFLNAIENTFRGITAKWACIRCYINISMKMNSGNWRGIETFQRFNTKFFTIWKRQISVLPFRKQTGSDIVLHRPFFLHCGPIIPAVTCIACSSPPCNTTSLGSICKLHEEIYPLHPFDSDARTAIGQHIHIKCADLIRWPIIH